MNANREDVLKALDQVIDPVSGRSVVQQDMIQGLVVKDGHVGFVLEVPAGRGPRSETREPERHDRRTGLGFTSCRLTAYASTI